MRKKEVLGCALMMGALCPCFANVFRSQGGC